MVVVVYVAVPESFAKICPDSSSILGYTLTLLFFSLFSSFFFVTREGGWLGVGGVCGCSGKFHQNSPRQF